MSLATILRVVIAVGLTAYLLWLANPSDVLEAAATADWRWIIAAIGLVLIDRTLMAYRWLVLLRPAAAAAVPLWSVLRVFFVSTFVGTFLPSVGGEAVRSVALARHGVAMADAVASVLVDRILGTLSILLVAAVAVWFAPADLPAWIAPTAVALTGAAGGAVVLGLFHGPSERLATSMLARFTRGKLHKAGTNLLASLRRYNRHRGALLNVLAGSIAVQVLRITQAWMLGQALGLAPGFVTYAIYIPVVLLVLLLPISPSGIGTSQGAFMLLFGASGVSPEGAFALSVLFLALGIVGNLPGGLLYATGGLHGRR